MNNRLLLVDDDGDMGRTVEECLKPMGWDVCWQASAEQAIQASEEQEFDAIVTDLNLGGMSGIELCQRVQESRPGTPIIVITAFGSMDSAISALRARAYDFMSKPVEMSALAHTLDRALQHRALREENKRLKTEARTWAPADLVGPSPAMAEVYEMIHRVCETDASVLLTGESGTGKELMARALHEGSSRSGRPFVAINCAAVPTHLLESELFGHTRGAFTDARNARKGLFEEAEGGTLLLDEVGEMPLDMQAKLLRVLQERKVRPVGGSSEIPFDARIVAATNRDLLTEVAALRFREDLYYRLNVVHIHVPPLRARRSDILPLAEHFLERAAKRSGKPVTGISGEAAKRLLGYEWPGNVRQLENWMERAVAVTQFEQVTVEDLPEKLSSSEPAADDLLELDAEHVLNLQEVEKRYIKRVLGLSEGNKMQAARLLGVDRRTLYRKLERYERKAS